MAKQLEQVVTIKRDETEPEAMELVAKSIIELATAVERMRKVASDRLIVLLLHDMTGVPKGHIGMIIDAAPRLAKQYLR